MHYILAGVSHKTAPVEIRERLAVPESKIKGVLTGLLEKEEVQEVLLLSTCNRVEACLVVKHVERGLDIAKDFLSSHSGIPREEIGKYLYIKEEGEAIAHLFRVAASLDSMVVGEPQIGGQVKEAYTHSVANGATGIYLNKLVHRTLRVSKRVRTETAIGRYPVSVSYAAVTLATKIFGNLLKKRVLVIGAGEMSELACWHLKEQGVGRILVANRTQEKAEALAREFEGDAVPFASIGEVLEGVDIVISSVEMDHPLITSSTVREIIGRRRGLSMFFIDLGVPRNIDPTVNQVENVYLYDIDDLRGLVTSNQQEREREAVKAEGIIREEVLRFQRSLREIRFTPTIQGLSRKFEGIREREMERFFTRYPQVSEKERGDLEAATHAIVNKILHDPILLMKTEEAKDGGPKYSEILKKLFKLEGS